MVTIITIFYNFFFFFLGGVILTQLKTKLQTGISLYFLFSEFLANGCDFNKFWISLCSSHGDSGV